MKIQFNDLHVKTKNVFKTEFFVENNITYDNISPELLEAMNIVLSRNITIDRKRAFFEMLLTETKLESDLVKRFDKYCETQLHTIEFYCLKFGDEEGQRKYEEAVTIRGIGNTLEGQIKKYGLEEGTRRFQSATSKKVHSLENFIKKHGEEKGQEMFEMTMAKKGQSLEKFIRLNGEEEGKRKYENWKNTCVSTEENFIARHGEELGLQKWNEFKEKSKQTEENFIKRHGETTGKKLFKEYCTKIGNTKENFVRAHGETEGINRWEKYKQSNAGYISSKESLLIFEPLTQFALSNNVNFYDIFYGVDNSFEYKIEDNEKLHSYDYTILPLKLIFEYNGHHVHPSAEKLGEKWNEWKSPWTKETADEVRLKDLRKIEAAQNAGFTVVVIWDFEDKLEVIERCKTIIKERI